MGCQPSNLQDLISKTKPVFPDLGGVAKTAREIQPEEFSMSPSKPSQHLKTLRSVKAFQPKSEHHLKVQKGSDGASKWKSVGLHGNLGSSLAIGAGSPGVQVHDADDCQIALQQMRSKLSVRHSALEHLRQNYGSRGDLLTSSRGISQTSRPGIDSVRAVKVSPGTTKPDGLRVKSHKRLLIEGLNHSIQILENLPEPPSKGGQKFMSTRSIQQLSMQTLRPSSRNLSRPVLNFDLEAEPAEGICNLTKSTRTGAVINQKRVHKRTRSSKSGNFVLSVIPNYATDFGSSKQSKKQRPAGSKAVHFIPLRRLQQSPNDGPSLFQRSNSTRFGRSLQPRAATCALVPSVELVPAIEGSEDEKFDESIRPAILDMTCYSAGSQDYLEKEVVADEIEGPKTKTLKQSGSNELGLQGSIFPSSEEIVASKREIKQINVLKGKSSPFNITIKARETQLMKP